MAKQGWLFDKAMQKCAGADTGEPRKKHSNELDNRLVRGKTFENRVDDETDRKVNQKYGV